VILIAGDISPTLEGLQIVNGHGTGLGGEKKRRTDAGGGLYVINATVTLSASQVLSNVAGINGLGGGLYVLDNDGMRLSGNIVSYNTGGLCAGLHIDTSSGATLDANTIRTNQAWNGKFGGLCIVFSPNVTVVGNVVADNYSGGYGVNYVGGLHLDSSHHATLINNVIHDNSTEGYGAGLNIEGCRNIRLIGNILSDNEGGDGSGARIINSEHVELADNVIKGNRSPHGAGVLLGASDFVTLTNNVIADNRATVAGSGLHIYRSSLQLLHTTIARNYGGNGSGIHIGSAGSTVHLANTILVSHTTGITVAQGSTVTLEATLWGTDTWANGADWGGAGTIFTGTVNLWDDPAFVDPEARDYHISRDSAAIDTGVDAGVVVDLEGDPRPSGAGYDIGADEFRSRIYLPLVSYDQ
jgi:parallel beta-helix repeat protein